MASDLDEVLSSRSVRAVESVAGLNPAKDAEKETEGWAAAAQLPPPWGSFVASGWSRRVPGGFQKALFNPREKPEPSQIVPGLLENFRP